MRQFIRMVYAFFQDEARETPIPAGYDGRLHQADDYDHVCTVPKLVAKGKLTKRKAAQELDCARATIGNALQVRLELLIR